MTQSLQEMREDLACALRWAARLDLNEGVCNHFSLSIPDEDGVHHGDKFLINPYGWHWSEITASSLVLCNAEGDVLEGTESVEDTAFYIHSRVHVAAPNAVAVFHTHMPHATALTIRKDGRLKMCEQNALMFKDRIAYDDDYGGLALDADEGDRLAAKLGNKSVLMMASHGVITTGSSVAEAFTDLYYLERAAMLQILAATDGNELRTISEEVQQSTAQQIADERGAICDRYFGALRRMLKNQEPDYLN